MTACSITLRISRTCPASRSIEFLLFLASSIGLPAFQLLHREFQPNASPGAESRFFAPSRMTGSEMRQPIVEIFAKTPGGHSLFQLAIRRGDDADVRLSRAIVAHALIAFLLEHA